MTPVCPWCADPNSEEISSYMCQMHVAEFEGLSRSELDRRDAIQYAEYLDSIN